ncbi:peptidase inhibitor family I36 protein [Streptomyces jietaisiensis]|uniref:peptidase inhibitor family I36 protein n=1 Tax=Streptomyces griseoaurantiacus TaxID=68213 RepID=UPI00325634A7
MTRCEKGQVCLYDGHNLTGHNLQLKFGVDTVLGLDWNDRASSIWNRGDGLVCINTDDYHGYHYTIPPEGKQELLYVYDNAVSSLEYGGCGG